MVRMFVLSLVVLLGSPFHLASGTKNSFFEDQCARITTLIQNNEFEQATSFIEELQEEARIQDNKSGMAYACYAVGDLYQKKGMLQEAIKTYEESLGLFTQLSESHPIHAILFQKLLHLYLLGGDKARMDTCLTEIRKNKIPFSPDLEKRNTFYQIHHYLQINEHDKATTLLRAQEKVDLSEALDYFLYFTAKSQLWRYAGKNILALECLTDSMNGVFAELDFIDQNHLLKLRATQYLALNIREKAIADFQQLWDRKDSLNSLHYRHEINGIRGLYQVNRAALEHTIARTNYLTFLIVLISLILLFVFVAFICIYNKTHKLIRRKEEQLAMIEKARYSIQSKNAFLSNMSHEIRTPLNSIVGFSSLLCATPGEYDDDDIEQANKIIALNSALLLKLINDVIDLSHLNLGEIDFKFDSCDVILLCNQVMETVKSANKMDIELLFRSDVSYFSIETDPNRLQQVLINLLTNAVKFTSEGSICLEVHKTEEQMVEFSVTDTGCGIPAEKQSLLFRRYGKLQEKTAGFGLGLSICYLIIEQLGGKIWLDKTYTQGARFVFSHPVTHKAALTID
ncbi:MAG: ATP-binding protein [Bacteroidales bacterium]